MPSVQNKRICFTLNNYSEEDEQRIQANTELYLYAVYGRETAPTTGTRHLQGFINFKKKQVFRFIREILGGVAHVVPAKGSDEDNQIYCTKDGEFAEAHLSVVLLRSLRFAPLPPFFHIVITLYVGSYWEFGSPSKRGNRTDLHKVAQAITDGMAFGEVVDTFPCEYIRYSRGIEKLHYHITARNKRRQWKTSVYVFIGTTGSGKSHTAQLEAEQYGGGTYYKPRGKWWDGLGDEENIVIDDFYGWIKFDEMLRLCDKYPHQVEVKGGYKQFFPKRIWITSNKEIEEWWHERDGTPFTTERLGPLRRRIDKLSYFSFDSEGNRKREDKLDVELNNAINEIFE